MLGLMQDWPMVVTRFLDHAAEQHSDTEIVTATVEGGMHRYTYKDCHVRSKKLAQALQKFGIKIGDRVATLAWNTYRHVEAWYGIAGIGAVAHTINPRLFAEQIIYIANHAEDRLLLVDLTFVPLVEALQDKLTSIEAYVILTDKEHMPETSLKNVICYEDFVEAEDGDFKWPEFDENTAAGLCYTSGTTGNPKGVLYSHRSNVLHTFAAISTDTLGLSARDTILPVVPMFHANAWGIPYATAATGAKLVLNGPVFDGENMYKLLQAEKVTRTAAVPTVWLMLLDYMQKNNLTLDDMKSVTIGGSAAPRSMIEAFQENYGIEVTHAWGMTETSPIGTVGTLNQHTKDVSGKEKVDLQCKQGRAPFGVELKITDGDGKELPHDGKAFGHLLVRGPWIVKEYFKSEGGVIVDEDGWFDTGDVATIDPAGYMQITDRSKDVVKSGGEWISSIELENAAVGHPAVAEAAVIGVYHPKWDERPLLICILNEGASLTLEEMHDYLSDKVAKWWLPDDLAIVDEIPHTATGKIKKLDLREQFKDYKLPTA